MLPMMYYVQKARRVAFSNAVPWTFTSGGISEFELRRANTNDPLLWEARYDGAGTQTRITGKIEPNFLGVHVKVENGLISKTVSK